MKKIIFFSSLFLLIISLFVIIHVNSFLNKKVNQNIIIFVDKGYGINNIVNELYKNDIVDNKLLTKIVMKIKAGNKFIKYGEYFVSTDDTINDVLNNIINNKVYYRSITFAEGLSNHTILNMIKENEFLTGDIPENIREGTLLPQTYKFLKGDSRKSLIERMQKDMKDVVDKYWADRDKNLPFNTKEEALILASIVEKETGIPSERPLVASVFINRLKINMPLQSDPTAIYAYAKGDITKEKDIKTHKLIRMENEYNTYKIRKLPPTPICNAGEDAIKAVLNPAKTNFLYFVANGSGGHDFSETYNEHLKKVNKVKNFF